MQYGALQQMFIIQLLFPTNKFAAADKKRQYAPTFGPCFLEELLEPPPTKTPFFAAWHARWQFLSFNAPVNMALFRRGGYPTASGVDSGQPQEALVSPEYSEQFEHCLATKLEDPQFLEMLAGKLQAYLSTKVKRGRPAIGDLTAVQETPEVVAAKRFLFDHMDELNVS